MASSSCTLPAPPRSSPAHVLMLLLLIQVDCAPADVLLPIRVRAAIGRALLVPLKVLEDRDQRQPRRPQPTPAPSQGQSRSVEWGRGPEDPP